ncbi:hypothetical protein D3C85_671110 [compost metagenome]
MPARVRAYIWRLNTTSSSSLTPPSSSSDQSMLAAFALPGLSSVGITPRRISCSAAAISLAASTIPLTALP